MFVSRTFAAAIRLSRATLHEIKPVAQRQKHGFQSGKDHEKTIVKAEEHGYQSSIHSRADAPAWRDRDRAPSSKKVQQQP